MLNKSKVARLIELSFKKVIYDANVERKKLTKKFLDYFHGNQDGHTIDAFKQLIDPKSKCNFQIETVNLTKCVIDAQAMLFKKPPRYTIKSGTKKDEKKWNEIVRRGKLNLVMKTLNAYVKLLKTCVLHPIVRDGKIEFDILPGHLLDVIVGENPTIPVAYYYEIAYTGTNLAGASHRYVYWDKDDHFKFDQDYNIIRPSDDNKDCVNPYGVIPMIPFHDYLPTDTFWLEGDSIVSANEALNVNKTDLGRTKFNYGFPVGVEIGIEKKTPTGQGTFINLKRSTGVKQDADFKFVHPDAPIDELDKAIDSDIRRAAMLNKVPAFILSDIPREESGKALRIQQHAQLEMRANDIEIYRAGLQDLFQIVKRMEEVRDPTTAFSSKCELMVDFAEPEFTADEKVELEILSTKQKMGIISKVDIMKHFNPDMSNEEALEKLDLVASENEALKELGKVVEDKNDDDKDNE